MTVALLPSTLPQNMLAVRLTASIPGRDLSAGDILFVDPTGTPERGDLAVIEHTDGRKAIAIVGSAGEGLTSPTTGELLPDEERDQWTIEGLAFERFQRLKAP